MNMKKIFSGILAVVMIFTSLVCINVSAASGFDYNEAKFLLNKLEIIEIDETTEEDALVTRAEFADFLGKALKLGSAEASGTYFVDVPVNHWAAGSINTLVDLDVISKAKDKRFNPDEYVTYAQACKMLVVATGFKPYTNSSNIMQTYIATAKKVGFDIEVDNPDALKFSEVVQLLYKAMMATTTSVVGIKGDEYTVGVTGSDNIMSIYHDIYKKEGVVLGYFGQSMSDTIYDEDEICIDGNIYKIDEDFSPDGLIGKRIEFIYQGKEESAKVLYAEIKHEDSVKAINSDKIQGYNDATKTISYYKDDMGTRAYTISFDRNAKISYNGKLYKGKTADIFKDFTAGKKKGTVELIKASGDTYDTLVVTSYELFVAGKYDSKNEVVYNEYVQNKKLDLETYENVIIRNKFGADATLNAAYPAPLLVAESDDKELISIICNLTVESLTIKATRKTGSGKFILIGEDDKEYVVDNSIYKYEKNNISVGNTYDAVVDIYGDIVYLSKSESLDTMLFGYLRGIQIKDNTFGNSTIYMSIYETDGKFHTYTLGKTVKIDGVSYKTENYKKVLEAIPGDMTINDGNGSVLIERQLIRYKANTSGEIREIDTYTLNKNAGEDPETTLTNISGGIIATSFRSGKSGFDMKILHKQGTTKYFFVPAINSQNQPVVSGISKADDESLYRYNAAYAPGDYMKYNLDAYKFTSDSFNADVIVVYEGEIERPYVNSVTGIVFKEVIQELDENGDVVSSIVGYSGGNEMIHQLDESLLAWTSNLTQGDVYRIVDFDRLVSGKKIYKIEKMFDVETKSFEVKDSLTDPNRPWYANGSATFNYMNATLGDWVNDKGQITKGYVCDVKNGQVQLAYTLADADQGKFGAVFDLSGKACTVYDPENSLNTLRTGSLEEIKTYKNEGVNCDMVLIMGYGASTRDVYIIK